MATKKKTLVERFGNKLPAGVSKADSEAILQFLYGAFDKRTAKQMLIFHPYADSDESQDVPQLSIHDFCQWLQAAAA